MKKKTTTLTTLEVDADDLEQSLINNFVDIINDYKKEDRQDLKTQVKYFYECLEDIQNKDWNKIFREGFVPMCLDADTFEYVDGYFSMDEFERENRRLEILINPPKDSFFKDHILIPEENIQY